MQHDAYPLYEIPPADFPGALTEIPEVPQRLYIRGTLPPPEHALLTVVGSRRYSTYGKQAVEKIIGGLRGYPVTIISGLALGIDALAHHAALSAGLHTLSVPGSGLDDSVLYPRRNLGLAREILAAGGGLLSEFTPHFHATPWSFLKRNRIMAGIAQATLIIEAGVKSGTLVTARLATDYNRDVLAVPGSVFSQGSEGTHLFIKLGATPVTCAEDVLDALGIAAPTHPEAAQHSFTDEEAELLAHLAQPRTRDELIRLLQCSADEANARIMLMELRGFISESNGTFVRNY